MVNSECHPQRRLRQSIFLDRDGVLIRNRTDHVKCWGEVEFLPGVFAAMRRLAESPFAVVVVTNQGAVGRGLLTLEAAWELQGQIVAEIDRHGGRIDASYLCPHRPDEQCECRKPAPGMILAAQRDLHLNLEESWLIGDALSDLQAAAAAGVRGVLVRTGRGAEQASQLSHASRTSPVNISEHLEQAVKWILDGRSPV